MEDSGDVTIFSEKASCCWGRAAAGRRGAAGWLRGTPPEDKIFPYAYQIDDLPNGLRLVTVTTGYPNIVALYTVVQVGSRNEIEPGAPALRTCLNT